MRLRCYTISVKENLLPTSAMEELIFYKPLLTPQVMYVSVHDIIIAWGHIIQPLQLDLTPFSPLFMVAKPHTHKNFLHSIPVNTPFPQKCSVSDSPKTPNFIFYFPSPTSEKCLQFLSGLDVQIKSDVKLIFVVHYGGDIIYWLWLGVVDYS